jgi:eukaryotic-like serine/threonine-protein kinase
MPSAADASTVLFGVNPRTTTSPEAAFRELDDTQEHRPQRTQNRPPVAWIWVGIILTVAVIAAVVFFVVNLKPGEAPVSSSVKVPNVAGATYKTGEQALRKRDLVAVEVNRNSDTVPKGNIISTDPGSGTSVARQQEIRVIVSIGPAQVQVPDVTNQAQDAAEQALKAAGFAVGAINSDYSSSVPEGTVMSSSPRAGESQTKGTVVNLTVSNGKVQLPDVTGQPYATANSTLTGLGLTVGTTADYSCTGNAVTAQSVPPGDVAQGSAVTLTYCSGQVQPDPSNTPSTPADGNNGGGDGGQGNGK